MPITQTNTVDQANNAIINLPTPTADHHAANKAYVDQVVRGLTWKTPVRVYVTSNVNIASPGANLDGVAMVAGDRVALAGQSAQAQNGIYIWNGAAAAMTRATDADESAEIRPGLSFPVTEGSNADKFAIMTADTTIVVGTTAITFSILSSTGATYTAGNGLELSSGAFRVLLDANSGLIVTATGLKIDPSVVSRKYSQDIGNGSLTSITVTHNLGTKDVSVFLEDVASGRKVEPDVTARTVNAVTLSFGVAPTTNQYRATIQG